ncbi:metalloreductase STEAP4 [Filimonas sp.]|nr:metalloreductase STEAP4 [Filimonas sp.]
MKIGILGSGAVGRTLGTAFLKEGHQVMLGTRNVNKDEVVKWKNENPGAETGLFDTTAGFGELIVLATSGSITEEVIQLAGTENFGGKTVIDATNPIAPSPPDHGVLKFFTTLDDSLMERLQRLLPAANFVKAFNSVGSGFMYKPDFNGVAPSMFICGNSEEAKSTVTSILVSFGWAVEDMGSAASARAIEPLCMLWCIPGFLNNQWSHAFKLLKK